MITPSRALFLDRDGVINIDHGYVHLPNQFHFIEGIFELCRRAKKLNYFIFIVTNQAGIGRGYYTEEQFNHTTNWMLDVFIENGIKLDKVYYCPHHPSDGIGKYRKESNFRKPNPGMILQAAQEFSLNLSESILVGDKNTDIQAGIAAQVGKNIFFSPSYKPKEIDLPPETIIVQNLIDIVEFMSTAT